MSIPSPRKVFTACTAIPEAEKCEDKNHLKGRLQNEGGLELDAFAEIKAY
jgi:hypothetical protein